MALHTFALLGGEPEDFDREFLAGMFAIPDHEKRGKILKREGDLIVHRASAGVDLQSRSR
jgi:hypothetical protein